MKHTISLLPIGMFSFLDDKIDFYELFEKSPSKAALQYHTGFSDDFIEKNKDVEIDISKAAETRYIFKKLGLGDDRDFELFISEFSKELSKKNMEFAIGEDRILVQSINAFDELTEIKNTIFMRTNEWYSLIDPAERMVHEELSDKLIHDEKAPENIKQHALLAKIINDSHKDLEKYVKAKTREILPNFSSLIDPLMAARMLSKAGSLQALSKCTASNIQMMGAEKALFRHIKKQGKAPKYGLLFADHRVQNISYEKRGKVARVISAKLMLAARIDYYSNRDDSKNLKKSLEEELKLL